MFRKRKKEQTPGPTGSGRIIWNVDWWYWDDAEFPGLIDSENFSDLRQAALSEQEYRKLVSAMIASDIVSLDGHQNRKALQEREAHFSKLNRFLLQAKKDRLDDVQRWIGVSWERNCLNVLKAYINVLGTWGYPYEWQQISDARGDPAILVLHDGKPAACMREADIRFIQGRPYRFSADIGAGAWRFDLSEPHLVIVAKTSSDDGSDPVWQETAIV
jgi:hypothetical protein